jgi:TPR repeat protein
MPARSSASAACTGQGVQQDYPEAAKWTRKAAEQGYTPAQADLGVLYWNGQGVPQDVVLAYMWLSLV